MMNKIIEKVRENLIPLSFMLSMVFLSIFYEMTNNINRGVHSLVLGLDGQIPFVKEFIVFYIAWYPFLAITLLYFCFKDRNTYYKVLISYNIGSIVCYIIYYFYQTAVPRPELVGNDIFTKIVSVIYGNDKPYNCFPSIHCLTCYLMMIGINKSSARNIVNKLIINITGILIIASTVFVKQHVVLDAIAAVILGDVVYRVVNIFDWEQIFSWGSKPETVLKTKTE